MDLQPQLVQMIYDCIIIGAGPAGIVSSVQLKRAGFNILVFEKNKIGGLIHNANLIENYAGVGAGMVGKELVSVFAGQLKELNINVVFEDVIEISKNENFKVMTQNASYKSRSIIVATGTVPKKLEVSGVDEIVGSKLFYEVTDLLSLSNESHDDLVIIGGGDAGFDYALNLKKHGYKPKIITRGKASCLPLLARRVEEEGICVYENEVIEEIKCFGDRVEIVCKDKSFATDLIVVAIGRESLLPKGAEVQPGLEVAGDVCGGQYRQVHIATGSGLSAAMKIIEGLSYR